MRGSSNIHGEAWLRQRRLAQGFRPNPLARLLPVQQDVLDELLRDLDGGVRRGLVGVHAQMARFTLRLGGRSIFGRSLPRAELEQIAAPSPAASHRSSP